MLVSDDYNGIIYRGQLRQVDGRKNVAWKRGGVSPSRLHFWSCFRPGRSG